MNNTNEYDPRQLDMLRPPKARRTDPQTSHLAAAKAARHQTLKQAAVLDCITRSGAMSDAFLLLRYNNLRASNRDCDWYPVQSPSGLRTRRHELAERGRLVCTGKTNDRRPMQMWGVA